MFRFLGSSACPTCSGVTVAGLSQGLGTNLGVHGRCCFPPLRPLSWKRRGSRECLARMWKYQNPAIQWMGEQDGAAEMGTEWWPSKESSPLPPDPESLSPAKRRENRCSKTCALQHDTQNAETDHTSANGWINTPWHAHHSVVVNHLKQG